MAFVIKVEFEGTLRRFAYSIDETESISFAKLEGRVRDLLKIPGTAQLTITYKDKEDDDVTLSSDQELNDACVIQKLNPLRLQVVVSSSAATTRENEATTAQVAPEVKPSAQEEPEKSTAPEAYVKKIVECYAPIFQGLCRPSQIPQVMDDIVKKVNAQMSAATVTESVQNVYSSADSRQATPQDWLRSLPTPTMGPEKQDKTQVETAPETSPVTASSKKTEEVVHQGVTCDVCRVSPIRGTRYKAIKKVNYDLCGRCFERSGRADEYNRIEQPLSRPAWATNSVRMVRLTPASAIGRVGTCSSPKCVLAPHGGRSRPTKGC